MGRGLPSKTPFFKGRVKQKEQIIERLTGNKFVHIVGFVQGMGGIGKTELAVQVAHEIEKRNIFDFVIWYRLTEEHVSQTIKNFAQIIGAESVLAGIPDTELQKNTFRQYISEAKIFFILDNADFGITHISPILDLLQDKPVLVTSREKINLPKECLVELEVLLPDDAFDLAYDLLDRNIINYGTEAELKEVLEIIGYLPLAVRLVSSTIKNYYESFSDFLCEWKETENKLSLLEDTSIPEYQESPYRKHHLSMKVCFELSYEKLGKKQKDIFPYLSAFKKRSSLNTALYSFPKELKEKIFDNTDITQDKQLKILKRDFLNKFKQLSLIEILEHRNIDLVQFQFHPLIRELAVEFLQPEKRDEIQVNANKSVIKKLKENPDTVLTGEQSNVYEALNWLRESENDTEFIAVFDLINLKFWNWGWWQQLEKLLRNALIAVENIGDEVKKIVITVKLADIYTRTGRKNEASEILDKINKIADNYKFNKDCIKDICFAKYLLVDNIDAKESVKITKIQEGIEFTEKYYSGGLIHFWGSYAKLLARKNNFLMYLFFVKQSIDYWENNLYNWTLYSIEAFWIDYYKNPKRNTIAFWQDLIQKSNEKNHEANILQIIPNYIEVLTDQNEFEKATELLEDYKQRIYWAGFQKYDWYEVLLYRLLRKKNNKNIYHNEFLRIWNRHKKIEAVFILLHDFEDAELDYETIINEATKDFAHLSVVNKALLLGFIGYYYYKNNNDKFSKRCLTAYFSQPASRYELFKLRYPNLYEITDYKEIKVKHYLKQADANSFIKPAFIRDVSLQLPVLIVKKNNLNLYDYINPETKYLIIKKINNKPILLEFKQAKTIAKEQNFRLINSKEWKRLFSDRKIERVETKNIINEQEIMLLCNVYNELITKHATEFFRILLSPYFNSIDKYLIIEAIKKEGIETLPEIAQTAFEEPSWLEYETNSIGFLEKLHTYLKQGKTFELFNKEISFSKLSFLLIYVLDVKTLLFLNELKPQTKETDFIWVEEKESPTGVFERGLIACINPNHELFQCLIPVTNNFCSVEVGTWFAKYVTDYEI